MNILIPVDPDKRKPESCDPGTFLRLSGTVIVRYVNPKISETFSALSFAYYNHANECWENALPDDLCFQNKDNKVVAWYEDKEFESLCPDDDKAYSAAKAAGNESSVRTFLHQEGQLYLKNYIIKQLQK